MKIPDVKTLFSSPNNYTIFIFLLSLVAIPGFGFGGGALLSLWPEDWLSNELALIILIPMLFMLAVIPLVGIFILLRTPRISRWLKIFGVTYFVIALVSTSISTTHDVGLTVCIIGWFLLYFLSLHDLIFHRLLNNPAAVTTRQFRLKIFLSISLWIFLGLALGMVASGA